MLQKTGLLRQGKAHSWSVLVLILTLVALPKAGFLVRGIPITWGYLVVIGLGVIGVTEWLQGLRSNTSIRLSVPPLAWLIPFQTILVGTFTLLGYERPGYAASLFFSFVIMPYLMAGLANTIPLPAPAGLWLRNAVRFVLLYGMLTFLISNISGWFIELPGLTTMLGGDVPLSEKNNNRYGIYKFISTYSNGNIYGICLLMLLPLYARLEHGGFVFLALSPFFPFAGGDLEVSESVSELFSLELLFRALTCRPKRVVLGNGTFRKPLIRSCLS